MELSEVIRFVILFIILSSPFKCHLVDSLQVNDLSANKIEDSIKIEWDSWEVPRYIQDEFVNYLSGYDEEGRPILIFQLGRYDFKKTLDLESSSLLSSSPLTKFIDHTIFTLDRLAAENAENGPGEIILIYDLEEFSLDKVISAEGNNAPYSHKYYKMIGTIGLKTVAKFALQSLNKFGPIFEKISYGFFVNTAFIAESYLNTFRPIVGHFLSKFEQFGTRKEEWIPKVLRKLPQDQLPPQYGGHANFTPVAIFP